MARRRTLIACTILCLGIAGVWIAWRMLRPPARAPLVSSDPVLRGQPVYLYPASAGADRTPHAVVFFFGNDVGFWQAHEQLSEYLADDGYGVAGFDVRHLIASLPDAAPARRDSAFAAQISVLIDHARAALGGGGRPLVLSGHSFGAELALWTAVHVRPPGLVGVLAISPGARGHLRITLADLAERGEPREPRSFAMADEIRTLVPAVRVALVRGSHDAYGSADTAMAAVGARRFEVPFAGHSMRRLLLAGPIIRSALRWLI